MPRTHAGRQINRRALLGTGGAFGVAVALGTIPADGRAGSQQRSSQDMTTATHQQTSLPRNLDYRGVELLPGRIASQIDHAISIYGDQLPVDDILKGFRRTVGLDAPGNDLAGWARRTTEATFGQWLSGLARLACARENAALRDRVIELVDGWIETVPDGNLKMGTYGFEKTVCGLLDVAKYVDHAPALEVLTKATDWAAQTFDRSRTPATPTDRDGRSPNGTLEWYTLGENAYRAYMLTGDERFRAFAALWHYDTYWDAFLTSPARGAAWDVPVWLHAYSHVNTFCSAAAAYEATGDDRLLTIVRNAHRWLEETQLYASGGFGPGEWTLPDDGSLGKSVEWRSDTAEIPCGTWAGFKLTTYLLRATGAAHYLDWAERLLYNGIGAALPIQLDGHCYYYGDYRQGAATKLYHWDQWACCSGTYLQALAHVYDLIYLIDDAGPYVGLFVPSVLRWTHRGTAASLRQETAFPNHDTTTITVDAEHAIEMTVRVRVPSWSRGMAFSVNDEQVDVPAEPGTWAEIDRIWQPGDTLTVELGAGLRALPVDRFHPHRVALAHGPVVLAQEGVFSMPFALDGDPSPAVLDAAFSREVAGGGWAAQLTYRPVERGEAEQPIGPFRPLYDYGERTPHRVYHDLDAPRFL